MNASTFASLASFAVGTVCIACMAVVACSSNETHSPLAPTCTSDCVGTPGAGTVPVVEAGAVDSASDAATDGGIEIQGQVLTVPTLVGTPATGATDGVVYTVQAAGLTVNTVTATTAANAFTLSGIAPGAPLTSIYVSDSTPALRTILLLDTASGVGDAGPQLTGVDLPIFSATLLATASASVATSNNPNLATVVLHILNTVGKPLAGASGGTTAGIDGPFYDDGGSAIQSSKQTEGLGVIVYFNVPATPPQFSTTITTELQSVSVQVPVAANAVTYATVVTSS